MSSYAVVPAGGQSSRMGRPKLTLPLGDRTVIEHVIATLREGGIDRVVVVIGPHVAELAPLAAGAGASALVIEEATRDMRGTVERGLEWIEERHQPSPDDCWLLAPGDHPSFSSAVVRELLLASADPGHSVFVPTIGGRRGHPTMLRWRHVAGIRALAPGIGINRYLRGCAAETLELPVADPGILANLDTPDDYERLRGEA